MSFEKVAKILAEHLDKDVSEINLQSTFESLGLDSLDIVEVIMNIEDEFDISIESDPSIKTVADLVAIIDGGE